MHSDLKIELGPLLNLHQRLTSNDSPRSVALAKRTFQRYKPNLCKIESHTALLDDKSRSHLTYLFSQLEELISQNSLSNRDFLLLSSQILDIVK